MRPALGWLSSCSPTLPLPGSAAALAGLLALAGCAGGDPEPGLASPELGRATQPIIGGAPDEATSGVVGLALDLGSHVAGHCSGTLIASNLVLTARHCVAFTEATDAEGVVDCETATFRDSFPGRMLLASPSPVRPTEPDDPSYIRGREVRTLGELDNVCGSDIALIILERPLSGALPIQPRIERPPARREPFSSVGYGLTSLDDPGSDGTRQRADGSAVRCSGDECVELSGGSIRSSEWASVNAPICSGDSGGPALDAEGRVFGVASRGDPSCEVAVYGAVSTWAPFIVDTAIEAARLGGYPAPSWALAPLPDPSAPEAAEDGGCNMGRVPGAGRPSALALTMVLCAAWLLRRTHSLRRSDRRASAPSSASPPRSTPGAGCAPGRTTST